MSLLSHVWLFVIFLDCSPPGSSVHGTFQARMLEWISISSSRESFPSSNQMLFAYICCIAGIFSATEPLEKPNVQYRESENTEIHEDDYNVCSVQFSHSVMPNSLRPHALQPARLPCPSPTPRVDSKSCPLNRWCHQTISSSVIPFSSHLQSFPVLGSFQWVSTLHQVAKVVEFQLQHQSFQWIFRIDFL